MYLHVTGCRYRLWQLLNVYSRFHVLQIAFLNSCVSRKPMKQLSPGKTYSQNAASQINFVLTSVDGCEYAPWLPVTR